MGELVLAIVVTALVWLGGGFALRRIGPWRGDPRASRLAGLLVACAGCALFAFLGLAAALGANVSLNALGVAATAAAALSSMLLAFLALRLERAIRRAKHHA